MCLFYVHVCVFYHLIFAIQFSLIVLYIYFLCVNMCARYLYFIIKLLLTSLYGVPVDPV